MIAERTWLLACVLASACTSTAPLSCPEPQACPACPKPGPYAQLPAPDVVVSPSEPAANPDPQGQRRVYNNLSIYIRVDERPREREQPEQVFRVEVRNIDTDELDTLERAGEFSACALASVRPAIEVLYGDEQTLVVDAQHACLWGEDVRHLVTQHLVLALHYRERGITALYEGTSAVHDNRRLAVSVDKREFYVEAGQLAIYRHSVDWCDVAGLRELLGPTASCKSSPRRLQLLQRISL